MYWARVCVPRRSRRLRFSNNLTDVNSRKHVLVRPDIRSNPGFPKIRRTWCCRRGRWRVRRRIGTKMVRYNFTYYRPITSSFVIYNKCIIYPKSDLDNPILDALVCYSKLFALYIRLLHLSMFSVLNVRAINRLHEYFKESIFLSVQNVL